MNRLALQHVLSTAFLALAVVAGPARGEWTVTSDFENGSAAVDGIDRTTGTIRFRPGGDARRGWPCWWSFKVAGIEPGTAVTLVLAPSEQVLPGGTGAGSENKPLAASWSRPERAFYSVDDGRTWQQTQPLEVVDGRARYRQTIAADRAWFAWGPVFAPREAAELIESAVARCPESQAFELARTREGRSVPAIVVRAGPRPDGKRDVVWIQARQHAWESGGSWVGRGFLEWLAGDEPRAAALRERALVYFVPIMDVDSVATGNGGKGQAPQDHNRDWSVEPHFPEVAAAQRRLRELDADGRVALFLDLHNPAPNDREAYFFSSPDDVLPPAGRRNVERFFAAAKAEIVGPLKLRHELKATGSSYSPKWREMSKNWITANLHAGVVALTLETAWNTPHSTPDGYRTVGKQLGLAIEAYFRSLTDR